MHAKPRIILAVDRPGWAFHRIAAQLVRHLSDEFRFAIVPSSLLRLAECDVLVSFWWRLHAEALKNTKCSSSILCLYDEVSWCDDPVDVNEFTAEQERASIIVAASERIVERLGKQGMARPAFLCEDGVDCDEFKPSPLPSTFTVGWCGDSNARHGMIKGVNIVADACDIAGVKFIAADRVMGRGVPIEEMPAWYSQISCYVCASTVEGTPNPPLEALASGRPVVTTRVGILPRVIQHGVSGVFATRDAGSLAAGILHVKDNVETMSAAARRAALPHDWTFKVEAWRTALSAAAAVPARAWSFPAVKRRPAGGARPRFLLVADVKGWAFDQNERDMAKYLGGRFDFEHYYLDGKASPPAMRRYNGVFLPYHQWGLEHYWRGAPFLGSLRSSDFTPLQPGVVPDDIKARIRASSGWHFVTRDSYERSRREFPDQSVYLTNPVDMDRFPVPTPARGVIACWNGNAKHASGAGDVKGLETVVAPACKAAGVELLVAEYNTSRRPPEEMPAFYRQATVGICASLYEGASNSVMEAMASGLAVLVTDVGNHREMHESQMEHFGDSGMVMVSRDSDEVVEVLQRLTPERVKEMGDINRAEIEARWSWSAWADRYVEFFARCL